MKTFFTLMGIGCIVYAVALAFRRFSIWMCGITASGTIVKHETLATEDGVGYVPVVEFRDSKGTLRQFVSSSGDFPKRLNVGTIVNVLYSQSNPDIAYIDSFWHIWIAPITLAVLGITVAAIAWS